MTGKAALFADCLLAGVLTAVAALPVVTAYPAFAAACAVLRERVAEDRTVTVRGFVRQLRSAIASGPAGLLLPWLYAVLLGLDAVAVAAGVPGAVALTAVLVAAAAAGIVVLLRAAARWRPGTRWLHLFAAVVRGLADDPAGSALLLSAGVAAAAIAAVVPVTLLLVAGPTALAAIAVEGRARPGVRPLRDDAERAAT
jgi:hypothetical protein